MTTISIFVTYSNANAQTVADIARFSRQTNIGTARSTAMGGAFTALGGNVYSMVKNPAGVAVFRNTELSITLAPTISKATSRTQFTDGGVPTSMNAKGKRVSFQMDNLGLVMAFPVYGSKLQYFNFGVNYSNTNNFNREIKRVVGSSPTSMTHVWALQSGTLAPEHLNSLGEQLAYDTYLINQDANGSYFSVLDYIQDAQYVTEPVSQTEQVREKGYQGDYTISFGANISDKLYLGLGLAGEQISYKYTSLYREAAPLNSPSGLDYYDYSSWEHYDAVGFKANFGFIYRPIKLLRIGAAIHTPTWWDVNYDTSAEIMALYNTKTDESIGRKDDWYNAYSDLTSYRYRMRTAWQADFGIAAVLGERVIVSADAEFVAYSKSKYSEVGENFYNFESAYDNMNRDIRAVYTSRWNYAVGVEYKLTQNFSLRYGYKVNKSPYRNAEESDLKQHNCGIGWSKDWATIDISYSNNKYGNTTQFYNWGNYQATHVNNNYRNDIIKLTLGAKF